jgi:hypothetical protein
VLKTTGLKGLERSNTPDRTLDARPVARRIPRPDLLAATPIQQSFREAHVLHFNKYGPPDTGETSGRCRPEQLDVSEPFLMG